MKVITEKFKWLSNYLCSDKELEMDIFLSRVRKREFVELRQIVMAIIYRSGKTNEYSLKNIGKLFINELNKKGYDHATVLCSIKQIDNLIFSNYEFKEYYNQVFKLFKERFDSFSSIFIDNSKITVETLVTAMLGI